MKIYVAMENAKTEAIRKNYEHLIAAPDWSGLSKMEKYARMEIECGCTRQTFMPYLKDMGLEL